MKRILFIIIFLLFLASLAQATYLPSFANLGQSLLTTDVVFTNESGPVTIGAVTGDVLVQVYPVCTTNLTSAALATIEMGIAAQPDAMLTETLSTNFDAREWWFDTTPDRELEQYERARKHVISDGNDIILTLSGQVDTGAITFYIFWTALSSDGNVQ